MEPQFTFTQISPELFVYHGAVNCGILRWGSWALLIDCDDTLTPLRLAELGIVQVERIYCTQHRRPNTAGIPAFGAAVFAPREERAQFSAAGAYWADFRNRWHLYHCRPGRLAPLADIPVNGTVSAGDEIAWGSFRLRVLDAPGMSDGAVAYLVQPLDGQAGEGVLFCGDALYAAGQVWDVHSLQKNIGSFSDYHGFLGASKTLSASLERLAEAGAKYWTPAHGEILDAPAAAARRTIERLERLKRNYAAISALNHYFPHILAEYQDDPLRMAPAATADFPAFILPVAATSFALRAESGALFLIDCGWDSVLDTLNAWKKEGRYTQLEGCWVTHYHDDHVDALHHLSAFNGAPVYAEEHVAEIISQPESYFLPCISPARAGVDRILRHGETWQWQEFELTALHFPGQSFYHGGLLLRGHGQSVLFCGDSFAPTGLDDYTAGNRNFLGEGRGYRRCIEMLRLFRPDWILNQHQQKAFHFSDEQLDYMEKMLAERERLLAELLPWEDPNYGTDEGWLRAYPYDVQARAGGSLVLEVRASQHAARRLALAAEPVLPAGWSWAALPGREGVEELSGDPFSSTRFAIQVPAGSPCGSYPVPFRVTFGGRYLGQTCHAFVQVM